MSVTRLEEKSVEPPTMVDVKIQNPDGDFDEKHAIHAMKSICKRDQICIRRIYIVENPACYPPKFERSVKSGFLKHIP